MNGRAPEDGADLPQPSVEYVEGYPQKSGYGEEVEMAGQLFLQAESGEQPPVPCGHGSGTVVALVPGMNRGFEAGR